MIETLVMPLPSDPTDVIYDIAVVLGELFMYHLITLCCYLLFNRWTVVSFCFLLDNSCELLSLPSYCVICHVIITLLLCTLSCHHYLVTMYSIILSLPWYYVLCHVIITLLLCTQLCHYIASALLLLLSPQ